MLALLNSYIKKSKLNLSCGICVSKATYMYSVTIWHHIRLYALMELPQSMLPSITAEGGIAGNVPITFYVSRPNSVIQV